MTPDSLPAYIAAKIRASDDGCWRWTAATVRGGYGLVMVHRKGRMAHRVVWEFLVGPIRDGMVLDHLCRVTACVNPSHLREVTQRINVLSSPESLPALNARKTACDSGHEFTPENTYRYGNGRYCKTCRREATRRYQSRRRSA